MSCRAFAAEFESQLGVTPAEYLLRWRVSLAQSTDPLHQSSWPSREPRAGVERIFCDISTERLRRGAFTSGPELVAAINEYVAHHSINPKPFIWTQSARDILQKVIRANSRLSSKQNETLHQFRGC